MAMIVLYVLGYFNRNKQNSYAALIIPFFIQLILLQTGLIVLIELNIYHKQFYHFQWYYIWSAICLELYISPKHAHSLNVTCHIGTRPMSEL